MSNLKQIIKYISLSILLYIVFYIIVSALNTDTFRAAHIHPLVWLILGLVITMLYIIVIVIMVTSVSNLKLKWWHELIFGTVAIFFFMLVNPSFKFFIYELFKGIPPMIILEHLDQVEFNSSWWVSLLSPIFLILSGSFFGGLLSRIIKESAMIFPVAISVSLIDIWGVYFGFIDKIAETTPVVITGMASAETITATPPPEAVEHLPVHIQKLTEITPPDTIGFGDFLFLGFFMFLAFRFAHSVRRSAIFMMIGIFIASAIMAIWGNHISYLPGLPFIAGGYIFANLSEWKKLTKQEWYMTAGIAAALVIVIIIFAINSL